MVTGKVTTNYVLVIEGSGQSLVAFFLMGFLFVTYPNFIFLKTKFVQQDEYIRDETS